MNFFNLIIFLPFLIYSQTENDLRYQVNNLLKQQNLTGAVWSMVTDGDAILVNSSGLKNTNTNEKLKPTDAIQVGSITKSFLAMGILRLATENRLNIDESVQKYLPELTFNNPWKNRNPVTIRHLLDHTSGISNLAMWHFLSTSSTPNTPLINAFKNDECLLNVQTKPGTIFSYSNMGYTILGMIVEKVTGSYYENYLDANLLLPLGMKNSSFQFVSQIGEKANKSLAMGHFEDGRAVSSASIYLRPAAQFTTTAYDMGLFMKFLMNDGIVNNRQFIDTLYIDQLGSPRGTIAIDGGLDNGYSFGVQKKDWYGRISLSHSGNIIGYRAYYYVFPKEKKALFVSYNIDHETADYYKVNRLLIDALKLPVTESSTKTLKTEEILKSWNGYYIPVFSQFIPFRLLDYLGGFTKVSITENGADIVPFQKKKRGLKYVGDNLFRANKNIEPSHLLYKDKQGSLYITTGFSTIKQISGIIILLVILSFIMYLIGLFYLLINGIIQILKHKEEFIRHHLAWSFSSIIILLIGVTLITLQPFMEMGNLTIGSGLLAISSLLMPVFSIISIIQLIRNKPMYMKSSDFWGLISIIQFSILLYYFGMIPLTLWH